MRGKRSWFLGARLLYEPVCPSLTQSVTKSLTATGVTVILKLNNTVLYKKNDCTLLKTFCPSSANLFVCYCIYINSDWSYFLFILMPLSSCVNNVAPMASLSRSSSIVHTTITLSVCIVNWAAMHLKGFLCQFILSH